MPQFVTFRQTLMNIASIDSIMAGSHKAGEPTCFLLTYIGSDVEHPIKGEDADAFALDLWRVTGRDLYKVTGVAKPDWVAQEMAPPVLKPSRPVLFTDGDDPMYLEKSLGLKVAPLRRQMAGGRRA